MDVTIIGTGNMARALGTRLTAGAHRLTIAGRDPLKARALAAQLGPSVQATEIGAETADRIVLLAIRYAVLSEIIERYSDRLAGRILVDMINPIAPTYDALVEVPTGSVAEEISDRLPQTRVVKAFNTTFHDTLLAGTVGGAPLDVFVAGDDPEAKREVGELILTSGMCPIDTGPLQRARQLEAMALIHIVVQEELGTGFASALQVVASGPSRAAAHSPAPARADVRRSG